MIRTARFRMSSLAGFALSAALAAALAALPARAQQQAKFTVNDDCTVFTFSPDGRRIVYAARRISSEHQLLIQHDDIWQVSIDGHKKRLVEGKKLVKSPVPFSYVIKDIRVGPDGNHMTVEMDTRYLTPPRRGRSAEEDQPAGKVKGGVLTDLMDGEGKEINIQGIKNSAIPNAVNATWLADGQTVVFMTAAPDSLLYSLASVRPASGVVGPVMKDHYYVTVAWDAAHNAAAAIERDKTLSGPIQLVWIDLVHQTERTLATLDAYAGQLTVSPSGREIAYFHDGNTIEVRPVSNPEKVTRVQVPFGHYKWSPDDAHLMLKRGPTGQSDQIIWIDIASGKYRNVLDDLIYSNFALSPDGHWVAVTEPGKRVLKLFPAP
jgi:hypothetical protein